MVGERRRVGRGEAELKPRSRLVRLDVPARLAAGRPRQRQETSGSVRVKPAPRLASIASAISTIAWAALAVGIGDDERHARVGGGPEPRVERHGAEEPHPELGREPLAAAGAEDLGGHVLDRRRAAACPFVRAICAARLATSWASGCGVVTTTASARGSICPSEIETSPVPGGMSTTQHVELAPVDVLQELLERAVQHRPAPHQRLVVVDEEADRHQLQVVRDRRDHQPVDEHRLLVDPEHVRDRVAVDVGVEDADPAARAARTPPRG